MQDKYTLDKLTSFIPQGTQSTSGHVTREGIPNPHRIDEIMFKNYRNHDLSWDKFYLFCLTNLKLLRQCMILSISFNMRPIVEWIFTEEISNVKKDY